MKVSSAINLRRKTAESEKARDIFSGNHQPRIMKQNVPYKPLSSHAATRQTNTPTTEEPASHSYHSKENKIVSAAIDEHRKIVKKHFSGDRGREPHDPLDDNLFFADLDSNRLNVGHPPSRNGIRKQSVQSHPEHADDTDFESESHGKVMNVPYFDSFGKKGQLDEMVLRDQFRESAIFNISESQQLNFTFGNSGFQKALLQNNSSSLAASNIGQFNQHGLQVIPALAAPIQPEASPQKPLSQGRAETKQETPPHCQKSQRLKIPIKIVSSAGKLQESSRDDVRGTVSTHQFKPPRSIAQIKEGTEPGFGRDLSTGKTIASQLRPEKLVLRKANNA